MLGGREDAVDRGDDVWRRPGRGLFPSGRRRGGGHTGAVAAGDEHTKQKEGERRLPHACTSMPGSTFAQTFERLQ